LGLGLEAEMSMVWVRPAPLVEGFTAAAAKVFSPASLGGGLVKGPAVGGLAVEVVVVELGELELFRLGACFHSCGSIADWNTTASASTRRWAATLCGSKSDFANLASSASMAAATAVYTWLSAACLWFNFNTIEDS